MHLAQLNIARLKYDFEDQRVADFVNGLASVNAAAEQSEGFVWRLNDDGVQAASVPAFSDERIVANMSVWRDAGCLERYVWTSVHKDVYRRGGEWFEALDSQHFVMWWVDEGHIPTLEEAKARLDSLNENGDSDFAFGWSHLPHVKLWQQARCA
jgi:hypothetical protein